MVIFEEGDDVLFYMDYFKYSSEEGMVLTGSDTELFQSVAQLGIVVSATETMLKVRIPGQPVEVVFDVPIRYARKPRKNSWFGELGGKFGSVYVYLALMGILVWV